jgi:hypothetical protein
MIVTGVAMEMSRYMLLLFVSALTFTQPLAAQQRRGGRKRARDPEHRDQGDAAGRAEPRGAH